MWAVDLSPVAAAYARFNADHVDMKEASNSSSSSRNTSSSSSSKSGGSGDLGRHVHVVVGSWFEPIAHLRGRLGGVLSNPPYIPRYQMAGLQVGEGAGGSGAGKWCGYGVQGYACRPEGRWMGLRGQAKNRWPGNGVRQCDGVDRSVT